jgi:hypothetical protein
LTRFPGANRLPRQALLENALAIQNSSHQAKKIVFEAVIGPRCRVSGALFFGPIVQDADIVFSHFPILRPAFSLTPGNAIRDYVSARENRK